MTSTKILKLTIMILIRKIIVKRYLIAFHLKPKQRLGLEVRV